MAIACASMAVKKGVVAVKTAVGTNAVPLELFAEMIKNCGESFGFSSSIKYTQLNRIVKQINWINENTKNGKNNVLAVENNDNNVDMDASFDKESVMTAVLKLGYDLSEEDSAKVYEEFLRVADKKRVGSKELEAIVASVALQVPATYKLVSYIVNNGNIISSSAQITLEKDGEQIQGIAIGDGPVDAAFRAIEQIIGTHFELDDFQIQSVTEGKEAMGSALVKLRANGKLYSGNGISTDIIGASMRAFLSAVNKIVYEEA
jgi:2-isopropylmalate synthase